MNKQNVCIEKKENSKNKYCNKWNIAPHERCTFVYIARTFFFTFFFNVSFVVVVVIIHSRRCNFIAPESKYQLFILSLRQKRSCIFYLAISTIRNVCLRVLLLLLWGAFFRVRDVKLQCQYKYNDDNHWT